MRLAVYGSRHQEGFLPRIGAFLTDLDARGVEVVMHSKLYNYLLHLIPGSLGCVRRVTDTPDFTADFAVCLGGDGSFLRTALWVGDKGIPVVGVNTGHLGFLASVGVDGLPCLPDALASGAFFTEPRTLVRVCAEGLEQPLCALNELTLTKSDTSSMISVEATVDGIPLADYRADGLIVATPTGSTAYNLSVGGPIVQPSAPVFIISPIAAHSLSMRPLVVGDGSVLGFTVRGRAHSFRLGVDGRAVSLPVDTCLTVTRAPYHLNVVMLDGHDFADTLRNKLQWG